MLVPIEPAQEARLLWDDALLDRGLVVPGEATPVRLHLGRRRERLWQGWAPVPEAWVISPLRLRPASLWLKVGAD